MSRMLIIDGYNFIYSAANPDDIIDLDKARNKLIEKIMQVKALSEDYGNYIIVFDGEHYQKNKQNGVTIIFTDKTKSADHVIEKLISNSNCPTDVILVTNDNISRNIAIGLGAKIFSTDWLRTIIDESIDIMNENSSNEAPRKTIEMGLDEQTKANLKRIFYNSSGS